MHINLDNLLSYSNLHLKNINLNIEYSDYFLIPLNLISGIYPMKILGHNELKLYLLFCLTRKHKTGLTYCGRKRFMKQFGYISDKVYKNSVKRLMELNLITLYKSKGDITIYQVNIPPVYNTDYNYLLPDNILAFKDYNINKYSAHFFIVPKCIFNNSYICKKCDITTTYVLLKLLRYCLNEDFYFVNPQVINIVDKKVSIFPQVFNDLCISEEDFIGCIKELLNNEVFFLYPVYATINNVEFQQLVTLCTQDSFENYNSHNYQHMQLLTPAYQIQNKKKVQTYDL